MGCGHSHPAAFADAEAGAQPKVSARGSGPASSKVEPTEEAAPAPAALSVSSSSSANSSPEAEIAGVRAPRLIAEKYAISKTILGRGGFGEVREAVRRSDGKKCAVKIISKLKFAGEEERQNMVTEVQLHHRVGHHPNVIELMEWSEDRGSFYMVVELATGGELMDAIAKSSHFSEKRAANYFRQMCLGLQHIHQQLVVHRDLKPENFLLADDSADAALKITDFGLSCGIASPDAVITDACGSAYYIAPEVFARRYTRSADVWALGINLFLLLSGTVPFGATAATEVEVYRAIQTLPLHFGPEWDHISAAARELISGLLEKDASKRYTLEQALAHPWVAGSAPDNPLDRSLVQSMLNFNAKNKFKKAALQLVASTLKAADVAKLRAAFHSIDTDNTGFITMSEMSHALKGMGITDPATVGALVKRVDTDGDGKISYEEFLIAVVDRQMVHHQNAIWAAFQKYDLDGDGKITLPELRQALKGEDEEAVRKYIEEFDRNGDGVIDYEEFMRMLLPKDMRLKITAY